VARFRDYDATDEDARHERYLEQQRAADAAAMHRTADLVDLLGTRSGRRLVRRQMREAGFDVRDDSVRTGFNFDHAQMAFFEGLRTEALRWIWPIMRGVADGRIPFDRFVLLMTEGDE
jgi:hypothetical protein